MTRRRGTKPACSEFPWRKVATPRNPVLSREAARQLESFPTFAFSAVSAFDIPTARTSWQRCVSRRTSRSRSRRERGESNESVAIPASLCATASSAPDACPPTTRTLAWAGKRVKSCDRACKQRDIWICTCYRVGKKFVRVNNFYTFDLVYL